MKKILTGIVVTCFGFSCVNPGWATQTMQISPIVVQPYEVQQLTQDVLNQDRHNRDEEISIQGLIEQNNKLTLQTLARQQDEGLAKINQTMLSYRNAIFSRDQARIVANGRWPARYADLIALTIDVDNMTEARADLRDKSGLLAQKYQMLSALKDEMTSLNDKLTSEGLDRVTAKDKIIQGYKKIAEEQQDKIQMLVQRLDDMDHKIAHFDELMAEKDRQIKQLRHDLAEAQGQMTSQNDMIKEQQNQIVLLQKLSQSNPAMPSARMPMPVGTANPTAPIPAVNVNAPVSNSVVPSSNGVSSPNGVSTPSMAPSSANNTVALSPIIVNSYGTAPSNVQENTKIDRILAQKDRQIARLRNSLAAARTKISSRHHAVPSAQENAHVDQIMAEKDRQIAQLRDSLTAAQTEISSQGHAIQVQQNQIAFLSRNAASSAGAVSPQGQAAGVAPASMTVSRSGGLELPPIMVNGSNAPSAPNAEKDEVIRQLEDQVETLRSQVGQLTASQESMQSQADHLRQAPYGYAGNKALANRIHQQNFDIKAMNNSIRWLNQVLKAAKEKAQYYQLTSQKDRLSLEDATRQAQNVQKDLAQKQDQVDLLKSELENKITQLQNQQNQMAQMKANFQAALQDQVHKTDAERSVSARWDSNWKLAQQLIALEQQEESLLDEKGNLALRQYDIFDRHFEGFEKRMRALIETRRLEAMDAREQMNVLQNTLTQNQQEINSLKQQLEDKIAEGANQQQIQRLVNDLQAEIGENNERILSMKNRMQSGQVTYEESESLKQQLTAAEERADELKDQLDAKTSQEKQMTAIIQDYQKKLENAASTYTPQAVPTENQGQQQQIEDLTLRLQQKEAEVVNIRKKMYDLQQSISARDRDLQAKDLSLSIMQQKLTDERVKTYEGKIGVLQKVNDTQTQEIRTLRSELALATQQLSGMPSSDEIEFLRAGLGKATAQLKQKDAMIAQIKANAEKFESQYKEQAGTIESLKSQLQDAYDDLHQRNEDLKYKNLEVIRLKERTAAKEADLLEQVKVLTHKLAIAEKRAGRKATSGHPADNEQMQEQLDVANAQVKDLEAQLNQFIAPGKKDPLRQKLQQALNKIDEQGRIISILAKKLQACGQTVDLGKINKSSD